MTYEEAKARKAELEAAMKAASEGLRPFPRLANGLTPDDVKATPEYQTAKRASQKAFAELRKFNAFFMRAFRREYTAERRSRKTP